MRKGPAQRRGGEEKQVCVGKEEGVCVRARFACSSAASESSTETNQEIYLRSAIYQKMTLFMMFFYEPVSSFLK